MHRRLVTALWGLVFVCALALSSSPLAFGDLPSSLPAPAFELADAAHVDTLPLVSQHTTVDVAGLVTRIELVQVWEHLGDAKLFAFGIHGSVNRHPIEGLAAAGRTEPFVVVDAARAKRAVDHFRTIAARPALTNVRLSFRGFAAHDLEPSAPMDLYPGRPLMVLGRFRGPASGSVVVTGDGVDGP
jgi:Ca-activated chloride channel family protein